MLPPPAFHHIHLNSLDPDAAIDFYTRQFPSTSAGTWGGHKALLSPNNIMILFDKVATPPPTSPPSAIWHFGWHVPDARATLNAFKAATGVGQVYASWNAFGQNMEHPEALADFIAA